MSQDENTRWDGAQEGAELLREGEVDAAIVELEQVISADPSNEYAYYYLGAAHLEKGGGHPGGGPGLGLQKALKAYLTALELKPDYLGAMVGAGHTLRMMGRLDQAIRMGKQVLARDKNDPDALYLLGLVHFQRDEPARAADYFERFLATQPEVEVATEVQGILQVIRGDVVPLEEDGDRPD